LAADGDGITAQATHGAGIALEAQGDDWAGLQVQGSGAGPGAQLTAGPTGSGVLVAAGADGNGYGLFVTAHGTGDGAQFKGGETSGDGVKAYAPGAGRGIAAFGSPDVLGTIAQSWPATIITSNTTTVVKSGAGFLHAIVVTKAGGSANTITVYDNTAGSGTVLASINANVQGTYLFDRAFSTGLTVVTASGSAPTVQVLAK